MFALTFAMSVQYGSAPLHAQSDPLTFFKSYFVTGDFKVFGVGLNSTGAGDIVVSGVPTAASGTDVVAAFLYWQVVTNRDTPDAGGVGAQFRPAPANDTDPNPFHVLSTTEGIFAKGLGEGTPPCWSGGGGTGGSQGSKRTFTYRMDVLRYFNVASNGKLLVNGTHSVQLPVSNSVEPLGASLVFLYRQSGDPLRAVVMYDGSYTVSNATPSMTLTLKGFYDGKPGPARLAFVAGSGQANFDEITTFEDDELSTNAFSSSVGAQWDNPTFEAPAFAVNTPTTSGGVTDEVTTSISRGDQGSWDCVTIAAALFSTEVNDGDGDGLLNIWETSTTTLMDPNNNPLPNLHAMDADPAVRDLFIEIGYMQTGPADGSAPLSDYSYGGISKPAHSHLPTAEALEMVANAFQGGGVKVHLDIGQWSATDYPAELHDFLVPSALARGGDAIDEADTTACQRAPGDPEWVCQFSAYPGTVGWKTGYRFLRDEVLNPPPLNEDGTDPCDTPGTCERRFDENRFNMFRYTLFAHSVGFPKAELPCLDGTTPVAANAATDVCDPGTVPNPDFHIPLTNSGIGDFPGADSLITLGAFPDVPVAPETVGKPVGTPFMQASTLMHELGHNLERRHGGGAFEPNCKPTYLSVMNYLYQLRGLLDDDGQPHLNFAGPPPGVPVNEADLDYGIANTPYRLGWYVQLEGSYLEGQGVAAAQRRCDGSPRGSEPDMVRIDARLVADSIDWDADGNLVTQPDDLDVNYDGTNDQTLNGSDDWTNISLNQIGIRRNVGSLYAIPGTSPTLWGIGPTSIGMGKGDSGKGDSGAADLGKGDSGKGDSGKGDSGKGDSGKGDSGKGDSGKGDSGTGDLLTEGGEADEARARELANTPPNRFRGCIGDGPVPCTAPDHLVKLDWDPPNIVTELQGYRIYRVAGDTLVPNQQWTLVDEVPAGTYTTTDATRLVQDAKYLYFAQAVYATTTSDISRIEEITGLNDTPAISAIADRTIDMNTSTGSIAFTLSDEVPGTVTLSGSSSNTTLVPNANIVFGGSGANRTVTVTPAANQYGEATITITATDDGGVVGTTSFVLTVLRPDALLVGIQNVPPATVKSVKAGSTLPMVWQYNIGSTVVDSALVDQKVTVTGAGVNQVYSCTNQTTTTPCTDPGSSFFRYDPLTKRWSFNLQTKTASGAAYVPGTYTVNIESLTPFFIGRSFTIRVTK